MAHYAFLDENNVVVEVIVGKDEDDLDVGVTSWEEYYGNLRGKTCKRTSYNTRGGEHIGGGVPFRKNYAGIGYTYDDGRDAFIPLKPFNSWILNEITCLWEPPIPRPEDTETNVWMWNEEAQEWDSINA